MRISSRSFLAALVSIGLALFVVNFFTVYRVQQSLGQSHATGRQNNAILKEVQTNTNATKELLQEATKLEKASPGQTESLLKSFVECTINEFAVASGLPVLPYKVTPSFCPPATNLTKTKDQS